MKTPLIVFGPVIVILLLIVIKSIAMVARDKRRREGRKQKQPADTPTTEQVPSGGEDITKGGFRADQNSSAKSPRAGLLSWLIFIGFVVLAGIGGGMIARNFNASDLPPLPPDVLTADANNVSGMFEKRAHFMVRDEWVPLVRVMPNWFRENENRDRKTFDSGCYTFLMRINRGEPFLYSSGLKIGPTTFSIAELMTSEVKMAPDGMYEMGYGGFNLLRSAETAER